MIVIDRERCLSCAACASVCPTGALEMLELHLVYDQSSCTNCGICVRKCPVGALEMRD